jgi:hypothetical protein
MGSNSDEVERMSRHLLEKDAEIVWLGQENVQLRDSVAALTTRIAELETLLGRNPKNFSMPPSAERFAKSPATLNRAARQTAR